MSFDTSTIKMTNPQSLIEMSTDPISSSVSFYATKRSTSASVICSALMVLAKFGYTNTLGQNSDPFDEYIYLQMIIGNLIGYIFDQIYANKEGFASQMKTLRAREEEFTSQMKMLRARKKGFASQLKRLRVGKKEFAYQMKQLRARKEEFGSQMKTLRARKETYL